MTSFYSHHSSPDLLVEEREPKLPHQLSPAVLAILLEDLIEYNGISYRTVPLRTFRGKYIGLYFGALDGRCEAFLEHLRNFYVIMNHKFECVLVSSDGSDDAYARHSQLTSWPAYPRGDFRVPLLRNHFHIQECPTLIIVDSNGIVVTSNGVEKILEDQAGFPWTEKIIASLWGQAAQGKPEKGLRGVLDDLDLPAVNGVPALQHHVVGLLFGELWCPETRDLMNRLRFLITHYQGRLGSGHVLAAASRFAIFYCHSEDLDKYTNFLDMELPFPTVQIENEESRQAIHHYLDVDEHPKFCIVSPQEGWVVQDGALWLKRDPTGVCFPWQPTQAGCQTDGFLNSLAELSEENLASALVRGPVFVAFLDRVNAHRTEAIATLRAASAAYVSRVTDRNRIIQDERVDLVGTLHADHEDEDADVMDILRRDLSRPARPKMEGMSGVNESPSKRHSMMSTHCGQGKVLWKVLQKAVEKQTTLHGSAPWNSSGVGNYTANRSSMSFFYSTVDDETTTVLSKFCCSDAKNLAQHQMWRRIQSQIEAKELHARTEMLQRFAQVTETASTLNVIEPVSASASDEKEPPRIEGMQVMMGLDGVQLVTSPTRDGLSADSGFDVVQEDDGDMPKENGDEEPKKVSPFLPRSKNSAVNKATEELLGQGLGNDGTAVIIDLVQGAYYVCGSLVDKDAVLRFLDAWDQGVLDPFEIRLPNPEEMVKDDEHDVAREMAMYSQQVSGMLNDSSLMVIPGIIIWIPSRQHSESHMGPESIFRALLNLAFQKCPREDRVDTCRMIDQYGYDADQFEAQFASIRTIKKLTPWIEKFWIFGLLDTEEAAAERGVGHWQPPHAHFLAELYSYVDDLVKMGACEENEPSSSNPSQGMSTQVQGAAKVRKRILHVHPPDQMLLPPTDLFDEGMQELRQTFMDAHAIAGNYNLCMRTARTRYSLHASMLDEIGYHSLVQYLPPPLFILLVGDLPAADVLPWPSVLRATHLHVLGSVPSVSAYRKLCPTLTVQSWNSWAESTADDRLSSTVARHVAVPWG